MDYENFKEQFVADVKDRLAEQGADVKVSINEVNKLNESYEAITVTPEGSNIGVNMSLEKFYDAVQDGTPSTSTAAMAMMVIMMPFFFLAMYEKNGQHLRIYQACLQAYAVPKKM